MSKIYVVGLGPGDYSDLPLGTYKLLQSGLPVYLRTEIHPVVTQLQQEGLSYTSFDDLYETGEAFSEIYTEMARKLVRATAEQGDIIYAVPGHPLMAEQSVQDLYRLGAGVEIEIGAGQSFLDNVCAVLHVDPIEGFLLLDATRLPGTSLQPALHTFVVQVFNPAVASDVKLTLMEVYPDDYEVTVVRAAGVEGMQRVERVALFELDRLEWIDHLTTLYVPPSQAVAVRHRDPWFATDLVRHLREPDGCPWDRDQTHESLRSYVIEEAYEVVHAIDEDDPLALADELGDLFLQILLHAQIASEVGDFTVRDVYAALADKLIRRHPHVFGDQTANTQAEANKAWHAAKAAESDGPAKRGLLSSVKFARPAHVVARALQEKAAEVGFDWDALSGVVDKVEEELKELKAELTDEKLMDSEAVQAELGDVLFSLINLARWLDIDVENALSATNRKFLKRFSFMEEKIEEKGQSLSNIGSSDMEDLWNQAKILGKNSFGTHD